MTMRLTFAVLVSLALLGCGVKSDLERPNAPVLSRDMREEKDPSKPPRPLGQTGGTTPTYSTGP
jgi:hypothetical protein